MKCMILSFVLFAASPVLAADVPTLPPIDFNQVLKDPRGATFPRCNGGEPDCKLPSTLGYVAYVALNSRQPGGGVDPNAPRNAALAWKIYAATEPLGLRGDEREWVKVALFQMVAPGVAYAACRMIVALEECEK